MASGHRGISPRHLHFLVDALRKVSDEERSALHAEVDSIVGDRKRLLEIIEREFPGNAERLLQAWAEYGGRAVHLWNLVALGELDLRALAKHFEKKFGVDLPPGRIVMLPKPRGQWRQRMRSLRLSDAGVDAVVVTRKEIEVENDGETQHVTKTVSTLLIIEPFRKRVVCEAHATQATSREAAYWLIAQLTGSPVPRKLKARDGVITPVVFTQNHVKALTGKLGMKEIGFGGEDPNDKHGYVEFNSKVEGDSPEDLDVQDKDVKKYRSDALTKQRYRHSLTHDDKFPEENLVRFYYGTVGTSAHPHVTFETRSSREAAREVLGALRQLAG